MCVIGAEGFAFQLDELVLMALREDIGSGDATTRFLITPEARGRASVRAKQDLVVSGMRPFSRVFELLDPQVRIDQGTPDGTALAAGALVAQLSGPYGSLLSGERTALNFLQRLSGIATHTRTYAEKISSYPAVILDTRKTTPGWRGLEKKAVRDGGGQNHRMGLFDAVLIKENHIAAAGGIGAAIETVRRQRGPHRIIEVEVQDLHGFREALAAGPEMILLDNMPCGELQQAVDEAGGAVALEASGNITLDTIQQIAATGVAYISCGALTHSAPAADLSMLIEPIDGC